MVGGVKGKFAMRETRNNASKFKEQCGTDIDMKNLEGEAHLELGKSE